MRGRTCIHRRLSFQGAMGGGFFEARVLDILALKNNLCDIVMIEGGIFKDVENVDVADPAHNRMDPTNKAANVNCSICKSILGCKYIEVPEETDVVKNGRFLLHLNKFLIWDESNMLFADTLTVTFHRTPNALFLLCRRCNTHLCLG
ncbi:unnamed protein product [Camellia sinensis]